MCMQRQINNQEKKEFKIENNIIYNISFYDLILFAIPVLFMASLIISFISTEIYLRFAMSISSSLSIILISYCLFYDSKKYL